MKHPMLNGTVLEIEQRRLVRRRVSGTIEPTHTCPHVLVSFVCCSSPIEGAMLRISAGTRILVEGPLLDYYVPLKFLGEIWHPGERLVVEGATILLDYIEVRDADGGPYTDRLGAVLRPHPRFEKSSEERAESLARANDSYRDGRIAAVAEAIFTRRAVEYLDDAAFGSTRAQRDAEAAIAAARIFDRALEAEGLSTPPWGLLGGREG